jgi:hypothetical protein
MTMGRSRYRVNGWLRNHCAELIQALVVLEKKYLNVLMGDLRRVRDSLSRTLRLRSCSGTSV